MTARGRIWCAAVLAALCLGGWPGRTAAAPRNLRAQYGQAVKAYLALKRAPATPALREQWLRVIRRFEHIYTADPYGPLADKAMFRLGHAYTDLYRRYLKRSDLDQALDAFRRLVMRFADSRLGDDAQFMIGHIHEYLLKNDLKAFREYLKVELLFPKGDMVAPARERLKVIRARLEKTLPAPAPRPAPAAKPTTPSPVATPRAAPASATPPAPVTLPRRRYYTARRPGLPQGPARVEGIQNWTTPSYTRVVIHLDRPANFEHHLLPARPGQNYRLYIDVHQAKTPRGLKPQVKTGLGLLRRIRVGQFNRNTVRVVLDLHRLKRFQVFALESPFRIVVDFSGRPALRQARVPRGPTPPETVARRFARRMTPRGPARVRPPRYSLARQLGLKIKRVIIDAGHGGRDPGAICGVIREKEIVLRLARLLKRRIEKQLGLRVILTRPRDRYVALEARTAKANALAGDIFISLHVNSHPLPRIKGIETYFLNLTTDRDAMRVAARENATSQRRLSDLRMILQDLMLNTRINESARLARFVQRGMIVRLRKRWKGVRNLGVKQAPFFVLMGAEMPAVLIEIGFLSNPEERRRIADRAYLARLAQGLTNGIAAYIRHLSQGPGGRTRSVLRRRRRR
jgi:N-acetylmuramoyl-L-alanine amidase